LVHRFTTRLMTYRFCSVEPLAVVVMGAHGHHPVRDLFFTSVTRAVLRDASVPVFVGA
jgi:nucleotide-binding universal stress UspA family protein